jgi:hypothetical protein
MATKDHRPTQADRTVRQHPSEQRRRAIEEHLERIRRIAAQISAQWTPKSMSAADAIREQRR